MQSVVQRIVVVDKHRQSDITVAVRLQVIAEQEHTAVPVMSGDFLCQVIRSHGGTMHQAESTA